MKNRVGEVFINTQQEKFTIIEYFGSMNCTIQFEDGSIFYKKDYGAIRKGKVKNLNSPIVYGVGYIGIGKYRSTTNNSHNLVYTCWTNMLQRACSKDYKIKSPTYKDVTVCEEWKNFQVFAEWFDNNYKNYMEGWHLDKDIICPESKVYSPETCAFVPNVVNTEAKILNTDFQNLKTSRNKLGNIVYSFKNGKHLRFESHLEAFEYFVEKRKPFLTHIIQKYNGLIDKRVLDVISRKINYTTREIRLSNSHSLIFGDFEGVVLNSKEKEYFSKLSSTLNAFLSAHPEEIIKLKELLNKTEEVEKTIEQFK